MAASISSVTTMGFGNGTFSGTMSLVVTMGYGIGEAAAGVVAGVVVSEFRSRTAQAEFRSRTIVAERSQ